MIYQAAFIVALLSVFAGPKVCAWLEDRADRRDAAAWLRMPGAVR